MLFYVVAQIAKNHNTQFPTHPSFVPMNMSQSQNPAHESQRVVTMSTWLLLVAPRVVVKTPSVTTNLASIHLSVNLASVAQILGCRQYAAIRNEPVITNIINTIWRHYAIMSDAYLRWHLTSHTSKWYKRGVRSLCNYRKRLRLSVLTLRYRCSTHDFVTLTVKSLI